LNLTIPVGMAKYSTLTSSESAYAELMARCSSSEDILSCVLEGRFVKPVESLCWGTALQTPPLLFNVEQSVECWAREIKILGENFPPSAALSTTNPTLGSKPAANPLSYGTAFRVMY
jgi:hypothetical protein